MSDFVVVLVLAFLAAAFAGIALVRTRGQDIVAWAVVAIAAALIVDKI